MTNSTGAECKSYSCEEQSGTHDEFIGYIHNLTMGSKQTLLRKGKTRQSHVLFAYLFLEMVKIKSEKLTEMLRQSDNTVKVVVYVKGK